MYEELVGALRHYFDNVPLVLQAADAIEELSRKYIEERNAAVELTGELAKMPFWIPVTERLPKESGDYLVRTVGGNFNQLSATEMAFWDNDKFIVESFLDVTHWMPLPEPPESEGE